MFKKLGLLAVIAFLAIPAYGVMAKPKPPTKICLNPGSYVFALSGDNIFRIRMDAGLVKEVARLPITVEGYTAGRITANACDLFYGREKPGQLPDLYHMNPSTGWEQNNITRSQDMTEMDPVLDPKGYRVAFTRYEPTGTNVVSTRLDGTVPQLIATMASSPAWQMNSPISYTDNKEVRIFPWGAYGLNHQYLPDRSGILVQDVNFRYFIWPVVGVPSDFGYFRSVAMKPSGNLAAVVTTDGTFEFITLDKNFLPYGVPTLGPAISGITSLAWIEAK